MIDLMNRLNWSFNDLSSGVYDSYDEDIKKVIEIYRSSIPVNDWFLLSYRLELFCFLSQPYLSLNNFKLLVTIAWSSFQVISYGLITVFMFRAAGFWIVYPSIEILVWLFMDPSLFLPIFMLLIHMWRVKMELFLKLHIWRVLLSFMIYLLLFIEFHLYFRSGCV